MNIKYYLVLVLGLSTGTLPSLANAEGNEELRCSIKQLNADGAIMENTEIKVSASLEKVDNFFGHDYYKAQVVLEGELFTATAFLRVLKVRQGALGLNYDSEDIRIKFENKIKNEEPSVTKIRGGLLAGSITAEFPVNKDLNGEKVKGSYVLRCSRLFR